jgi:integrase
LVEVGDVVVVMPAPSWCEPRRGAERHRAGQRQSAEARPRRRYTVGDLIDRYIIEIIPQKKAGEDQIFQLRQWQSELGLLRLSELTPDRIIKARDKLMKREGNERPVSNSTVNRYHAALAHALTVAEKQYGWIEINPMRRVPKLKEPQGRVRYLSDKERRALLDACRASGNPYLLPIVLIAITTGMRRGEIENLTWGDIDWQQDRIVIEEPKNGVRRSAPLLQIAKDVLAPQRPESPEPSALVFPGRNADRPIVIKKAWYSALSDRGRDRGFQVPRPAAHGSQLSRHERCQHPGNIGSARPQKPPDGGPLRAPQRRPHALGGRAGDGKGVWQ